MFPKACDRSPDQGWLPRGGLNPCGRIRKAAPRSGRQGREASALPSGLRRTGSIAQPRGGRSRSLTSSNPVSRSFSNPAAIPRVRENDVRPGSTKRSRTERDSEEGTGVVGAGEGAGACEQEGPEHFGFQGEGECPPIGAPCGMPAREPNPAGRPPQRAKAVSADSHTSSPQVQQRTRARIRDGEGDSGMRLPERVSSP